MRGKAIFLAALLLLSPGVLLGAEPVTYPSADTCFVAEKAPCSQLTDGRWIPGDVESGEGHVQDPFPEDEYMGMRQQRSFTFQSHTSGTPANPLVIVDMDLVTFPDAQPYLDPEINRVRVPIRFVAEAMGAQVGWEPTTQTVTINREQLEIKLTIDQSTATVNGQPMQLDAPTRLVENRTMVPLRFISEAFGSKVDWVGTEPPPGGESWWGDYQVWIWVPWGYWGTATIEERLLVHSWWWHRDEEGE